MSASSEWIKIKSTWLLPPHQQFREELWRLRMSGVGRAGRLTPGAGGYLASTVPVGLRLCIRFESYRRGWHMTMIFKRAAPCACAKAPLTVRKRVNRACRRRRKINGFHRPTAPVQLQLASALTNPHRSNGNNYASVALQENSVTEDARLRFAGKIAGGSKRF